MTPASGRRRLQLPAAEASPKQTATSSGAPITQSTAFCPEK